MSLPRRAHASRRGPEHPRDPRTQQHNGAAQTKHTEHAQRLRRDPRAQRSVGLVGPGNRLRIDRTRPVAVVEAGVIASVTTKAVDVSAVTIESPACWILAIPDAEEGRLGSHDRETLRDARYLADTLQGAVVALVFLPVKGLGMAGADRVVECEHPELRGHAPEARTAAILAAIENLRPRHVLFPDSPQGGGDIGRRIAARLGELPATHVQRIDERVIVSRGDGGRSDYVRQPPRLILIDAGALDAADTPPRQCRALDAPDFRAAPSIADLSQMPVDPNAVALAEAQFIIGGGAGLTDWDCFDDLASGLGAAKGGTRVVCDAGFLPRDRQIGASGALVAPRCYLALGISGAPQHLQGIARAERVIAVNTDAHAPMMKRADLAVVADAQEITAALLRRVEAKRHVA